MEQPNQAVETEIKRETDGDAAEAESAVATEEATVAADESACAVAEGAAGAGVASAPRVVSRARKPSRFSDKTKRRLHDFVVSPLLILCSAFLRAVCVHMFMLSFNFAPGGVTGIGTMIEYATGGKFLTGYTNIIINVPLVILAFIFLSKGYAFKTTAAIALSSVGMILMSKFGFPQYGNEVGANPVLGAAACGVLGGIACAMMIRAGGSNGGTDIIAAFIQRKYQATNITWFIMGLDGTVILVSFFVYGNVLTPVLMSLTQQFCSAMVGDVILTGFKSAIKYEVITDDAEALSAELIEKLGHSVTKMNAMGMYAHRERALLVCVVHKRQVAEFNDILKKYPNTFAYVSSTSAVYGKGFSS
ncbi:MAG: YitT family protein [Clostridia bacterium]|nr:YitT family protein [Clostridia bacterium]